MELAYIIGIIGAAIFLILLTWRLYRVLTRTQK